MKEIKSNRSISTLLILIGIFAISVGIRIPNIDRPLSKHHEFVTAVSLRVLDIWSMEGAAKYHYNPVMTYPNKADKYLNNWASTTGKMIDKEGNYYYVSHPPFAYILPHFIAKLLHVKPNVLFIQIFHLSIQFLSGLFIYLIICLLGQQKPFFKTYWSGIVGFSIYTFNQGVMWFQCNTYMSDMLVHFFFIINVYIILKLLIRKRYFSPKYLFYYAIVLFLMTYTSWLGFLFALSVIIYSFAKLYRTKVFLPLLLISVLVSIASLGLTTYQYSQINGFENFVEQLIQRGTERGGFAEGNHWSLVLKKTGLSLVTVFKNYAIHYLPIFLLLISFIYLIFTKAKLRIVFTKNGYRFLWLSTLPVILMHILLLNYSGHDFTVLYGSLFLSVLVGILFDKLKLTKTLNLFQLRLGVVFVVISGVFIYFYINRPGEYSLNGDEYAFQKRIGLQIANNVSNDELVFVEGDVSVDPQVIYYAKRNVLKVDNRQDAYDWLKEQGLTKGKLFEYSSAKTDSFYAITPLSLYP